MGVTMMRCAVLALGLIVAGPVGAVDYSDHQAICKVVEEKRTHAWLDGEKERFRVTCPCEAAELEKMLESDMYKMAMDWMIDARAFAKNLPDGINPTKFMSEVIPLTMKAKLACE